MSGPRSSLAMSQITPHDAVLPSPISPNDVQWDLQQSPLYSPDQANPHAYVYNNYTLPPSPPVSADSPGTGSPNSSSNVRRMHTTPESSLEGEQLCLPTHQVFDFPAVQSPPSSSPSSPELAKSARQSISTIADPVTSQRSLSPAPGATKKTRGSGERITTKDFVPPDVSGLSKREARLVKNRAAAFLSRQRKREEFEQMEIRVNELEQENARLLTLTRNGSGYEELLSEINQLRSQLSAAEGRERELSSELARKLAQSASIKAENNEHDVTSIGRFTNKSGTSLGLMVLLCALPNILSASSHLPSADSFVPSAPGQPGLPSAFTYHRGISSDCDWSRQRRDDPLVDLDVDAHGRYTAASFPHCRSGGKLEFADADPDILDALKKLDISFDASPVDQNRIRVRIYSRCGDFGVMPSTTARLPYSRQRSSSSSSSLAMWAGPEVDPHFGASFSSQRAMCNSSLSGPYAPSFQSVTDLDQLDSFFGTSSAHTESVMGMHYRSDSSAAMGIPAMYTYNLPSAPLSGQHYSEPAPAGDLELNNGAGSAPGRRRVRISLKNLPAVGGEGGEWEIQFC